MAESVIVEKFGDGIGKLATERTSRMILSTLEKIASGKGIKAGNVRGAVNGDDKALRDLYDSMRDLSKETDKATKSVSVAAKKYNEIMNNARNQITQTFAHGIKTLATDIAKSGVNFTAFNDNIDSSYSEVSSGMDTFRYAMSEANLTIDAMSNIAKKYSATLNYFGIQTFSRIAGKLTDTAEEYGLTSIESAEMMGKYSSLYRMTSLKSIGTEQQRTMAIQKSMDITGKWSKVLGKSMDDMASSATQALMSNDQVAVFIRNMAKGNDNVRHAFENVATMMSGEGTEQVRTMFLDMTSTFAASSSDLYASLSKFAPEAAETALQLATQTKLGNVEATEKLAKKLFAQVANTGNANLATIKELSPELAPLINQFTTLHQAMTRTNSDFEEQRKLGEAMAKLKNQYISVTTVLQRVVLGVLGNSKVQSAIDHFVSMFDNFMSDHNVVKGFENIVLKVFDNIVDFVDMMLNGTKKFNEVFDDLVKAGKEFSLFDVLKKTFNLESESWGELFFGDIKNITGTALGVAVATLAYKVFKDMFGGSGSKESSGTSFMGGSGNTGTSIATGLTAILGGAGAGIAGLLVGLASGLKAFASPQVAAGAVVLGGTIAGSILAIGKAVESIDFEKISKGLNTFNVLDGKNLGLVGDGMVSIGNGMASMAGGKLSDSFLGVFSSDNKVVKNVEAISQLSVHSPKINVLAESLDKLATSMNRLSVATKKSISTAKGGVYSNVDMGAANEYIRDVNKVDEEVNGKPVSTNRRNQRGIYKGREDNLELINKGIADSQNQNLEMVVSLLRSNNNLMKKLINALGE